MKGTYILIFYLARSETVTIGKLGAFYIPVGIYAYVGSAFGNGGLSARLKHHFNSQARPHWHIDYLRKLMEVNEVWFSNECVRCEHEWARILRETNGVASPIKRFGASDCNCESHLFRFNEQLVVQKVRNRLDLYTN